jgi:hypothetical protein
MASKANWEFRIYNSSYEFDLAAPVHIQEGFSKKDAIWEAKRYIKTNYINGMVVKIQTYDREQIEIYSPVNRFGEIIFTKKV